MHTELQDQLQWRADLLMGGHYTELADQYLYPLTVYVDAGTVIVRDRSEVIEVFDRWRGDWKARGVSRVKIELTEVSTAKSGRFRSRSTLHEYSATGWLLGQRSMVYYFRQTAKGLRTEIIDVTRTSAAQVWPQDANAADVRA